MTALNCRQLLPSLGQLHYTMIEARPQSIATVVRFTQWGKNTNKQSKSRTKVLKAEISQHKIFQQLSPEEVQAKAVTFKTQEQRVPAYFRDLYID